MHVPFAISWADEERDLTAWLGNELQMEAFEELYKIRHKVEALKDPVLNDDYKCLQASDHFYYMCTKLFADGIVHQYFTPYDSPYEAFINYMNVLSDFIARVDEEDEKKGKPAKAVAKKVAEPQAAKVTKKAATVKKEEGKTTRKTTGKKVESEVKKTKKK